MNNPKYHKKQRILGAVLSSLFYSLFCLVPIIGIIAGQIFADDKMPWVLFIWILVFFGIFLGAIWVSLFFRIREIESGEEQEASKY